MTNPETILIWAFVAVLVALVFIVTIDSNLNRRRDRDAAAITTREGRAEQRYEDLRAKCAAECDAARAECAELHLGRVRSTMYAEALVGANTELKNDMIELRKTLRRERIIHRRAASSYEQFRIMLENTRKMPNDVGLSGANWRQIYDECNRWAIADIQQHQESLDNED